MHTVGRFPRVIGRGIALPFDQVLELMPAPVMSMVDEGFDFVLFFVLDQIRQWSREIGSMDSSFLIG